MPLEEALTGKNFGTNGAPQDCRPLGDGVYCRVYPPKNKQMLKF
jgi:hypothetical protein